MRVFAILVVPVLAAACGSAGGGMLADIGGGGDGATDAAAPGPLGPAPAPERIADDAVGIVGVTADGRALYRTADSLKAVGLAAGDRAPRTVSNENGTVQIRGSVVFSYADVDWTTNQGDLSVWAPGSDGHHIGNAAYGEKMAVASADGSHIAYVSGIAGTEGSLVLATADLATKQTLVAHLGLGSQTTCGANIGFVGEDLVVAWCKAGSYTAELDRFNAPGYALEKLATGVQSAWSADSAGTRLVYIDAGAHAFFAEGGQSFHIDDAVGWATILPDGSATLYTVSDQLRRSPLPDVAATPIVTNKFVMRAALSPDYGYALYSTVVNYDQGTRQDLRLAPTDALTMDPLVLEDQPTAQVPETPFTRDGKWALYLTDADNGGKTLHMQSVSGGAPITIENVGAIVAAHGSRVVYSHNVSDPEKYPVVADLSVVDPALPGGPVQLATGTTDGRSFYVTPDGKQLVFMKPSSSSRADLMLQGIP